jgi:hypothetical protein
MQETKLKQDKYLSKFPIINQGIIFPNSNNNVIYADIKKRKGYYWVYNMHLQSIKISPDVNEMKISM